MIPEGLDKTISTAITVGSAAIAFWAHRRDLKKEKQRIFNEAKEKSVQDEIKRYAAERDFGHIKRDLEQLKANTAHLDSESDKKFDSVDERVDGVERQVERLSGAVDVVMSLLKEKAIGNGQL